MRLILAAATIVLLASPGRGAAIIDGTKDAEYGEPLAVQAVQTMFGDNLSEWNAAYATLEGGRLQVMLTGNIESNFNKLEIFIDSKSGGQSVFDSSGNDLADRMDGLVFDAGFTADYHLIGRRGLSRFDLDFADLGAQSFTFYGDVFAGADSGSGTTGTGVNGSPISLAYDGTNTAGVTAGSGPADENAARLVMTGLEFSVALADLGYIGGPIRIMVGQNGDGHHYWSNQFLGSLQAPQGNLGGDEVGNFTGEGVISLQNFAGDQFFTVPEPSSCLLGLAGGTLLWSRRRSRAAPPKLIAQAVQCQPNHDR